MGKIFIIAILAASLFCGGVSAQDRGAGFGIIVGEPTGLSAKFWTGNRTAVDMAISWSTASLPKNSVMHLHVDYLLHKFNLIKAEQGEFPFYWGIGGRIKLSSEPVAGLRIPVGLEYLFAGAPVGIFLEIVPVMDLAPNTEFGLNAGLGVRYYFK